MQDVEAWPRYWKTQNQPWRTEVEIDGARQEYLLARLAIEPDLDRGIYPFKDVALRRADIEWLLATHEDGRGPVDIYDQRQRERTGLDLRGTDLRQADLSHLPLTRMLGGLNWRERNRTPEHRDKAAVHLEGAILSWTHLEGAELYMAHLERSDLYMAHLQGASLRKSHLEGASLRMAHLEGLVISAQDSYSQEVHHPAPANSTPYILPAADLRAAFFDNTTDLRNISLGSELEGFVRLADVQWGDVNLGVIDWLAVKNLGDEHHARQPIDARGQKKDEETRLNEYREAVRANRQLAVALQGQGLNEEAVGFSYRAQRLQRSVLYLRKRRGAYLFSAFLDLLAGYGYKPVRSIVSYMLVISTCTIIYYILGQTVGPRLSPLGSFVFSITSFHGRGFFPGGITLDDPITVVAALEAVVGLTIEISFIATFTQRFFGK